MLLNETPYWWTTAPDRPSRADEPLPSRADVVIIGSGYTGLSAARQLAKSGASVVVLEKETLGWGASSRNGGQVLTGLKLGVETLIQKFGRERARELFAASLASIDCVEQIVAEEDIDCEWARVGHIEAAVKPAHFDAFQRAADVMAREFDHAVTLIDPPRQHNEIGSDFYCGLMVDARSGALHPAKYARGLALAAQRAGASLHERTDVLLVGRAGSGFAVKTGRGLIEAEAVFVATNGYTDAAAPQLRRRVVPVASNIIASAPLRDDVAARLIPKRRVIFDSKNFLYYFRLSSDNRMLFGGRAQWAEATPDSTRRSAEILRRGMIDVFPELKEIEVEYAWSGNVCFTLDFFPHAGRMNDGVYYALGYGGHGVALATYLGAIMADAILGKDDRNPFRDFKFDAIPLYDGRPWFLPFVAAWYRFLDWIE